MIINFIIIVFNLANIGTVFYATGVSAHVLLVMKLMVAVRVFPFMFFNAIVISGCMIYLFCPRQVTDEYLVFYQKLPST